MIDSVRDQSPPSRRRSTRLGSFTYIPAPAAGGAYNGILMRGGLPVTLEVTEEILQEFMDVMSGLESDLSRRWVEVEI
ncbi:MULTISPECIES: hypothetical protein [Streptomyces]|uniref:hypothetical protein n=1 Tax=Streptomyces TaxID=1883 RepID=UPI0029B8AD59|nr:hypothetical protein [Streptomyces sp. WI03-4A]MDX2596152.1 hypothetical protein [Streptomyces sp. WI03-4A]